MSDDDEISEDEYVKTDDYNLEFMKNISNPR